jgi:ABC-type multidrug transport system ATPase subunit
VSGVALDGASFAYGDLSIVSDLDLAFEAGELTALAGPNGVGKTTVLELLAGLRAPDSGSVALPSEPARAVAYLPQSPAFCPGFTVRQTVAFYADLVTDSVDPVTPLRRVGLADVADRRVEALSGGMTRLLGLAQAFVGDPPVVLLDEPTGGLDPDVADRIFDVARDVADEGRTVVMATHDLGGAERSAHRVVLLTRDGVALDGAPAALLERTGAPTLREAYHRAADGGPAGGDG